MVTIEVKKIRAEETQPLRHLVLWPHIEHVEDCVIDIDDREDAMHLGVFVGGELRCICSLFELSSPRLTPENPIRLRAMATHPDSRGQGLGRRLVEFAIEQARMKGYDMLWCDAREVALGFYTSLGFEVIDQWYEVPKIGPHKTMYFPL